MHRYPACTDLTPESKRQNLQHNEVGRQAEEEEEEEEEDDKRSREEKDYNYTVIIDQIIKQVAKAKNICSIIQRYRSDNTAFLVDFDKL